MSMSEWIKGRAGRRTLKAGNTPPTPAPDPKELEAADALAEMLGLTQSEALAEIRKAAGAEAADDPPAVKDMNAFIRKAARRRTR